MPPDRDNLKTDTDKPPDRDNLMDRDNLTGEETWTHLMHRDNLT